MSPGKPAGKIMVIRADADARMGTGHVMRCLALAQAWQDTGGRGLFLMAAMPPALKTRLAAEGMEALTLQATPGSPEDARETAQLAQSRGADWVVADGYHFGADYQRLIKDAGLRLLCIDDYGHAGHYCADLVLNQNINATEELYPSREAHTRLLLGTRYVLLRREFWPWRGWRREIPEVARKVLVTLGGGDPDNVTQKVMHALAQVQTDSLEAVVVAGAANPHLPALQASIAKQPHSIRLEANVTNMPKLMAWADLAITAGGSTCWETAFMGLPSLIIILAENQRFTGARLEQAGLAHNFNGHKNLALANVADSLSKLCVNLEGRQKISLMGQKSVDGFGTSRALRQLSIKNLKLRRAVEADCKIVWEWSNEPEVRSISFSTDNIPWETHKKWFFFQITDPNCIFLIASNGDGNLIGQIRYDIRESDAVISVSIDKEYRGLGYGQEIIALGCETMFTQLPIKTINAYIKENNIRSICVFTRAGFINKGITINQGQRAIHLVLEANH
jgi:UDP-2,4-diacetamido-2,4,6-trideoxy-beta-L-altropyranose hydrolase